MTNRARLFTILVPILSTVLFLLLVEGGLRIFLYGQNTQFPVATAEFLNNQRVLRQLWIDLGYVEPPPSTPTAAAGEEALPPLLEPLPLAVSVELTELEVPIANAGNPTSITQHDTLLVRPDQALRFVLRPNVAVEGHILATPRPFNLDPPVLYRQQGTRFSAASEDWLQRNSRLQFVYTTDENSHRRTGFDDTAGKEVWIVGDSVAFGVGVDDRDSLPGQLQQLVGPQTTVVNAAVGSYGFEQVYDVTLAALRERARDIAAIVYVACQNDFFDIAELSEEEYRDQVRDAIEEMAALGMRYDVPVAIAVSTYMQYSMRDLFHDLWHPKIIRYMDILKQTLRESAEAEGVYLIDWDDVLSDYRQQQSTVFAGFELYVDHVHLSPEGNALFAARLVDGWIRPELRDLLGQ